MRALPSPLRKRLETAVLAARRAAESAARASTDGLGVFRDRRPEHLDADQAALRNGLRAKWRQLGGDRELLIAECAYEQWHRLLFARFLAENGLLLHPQYNAPVTIADCEELAAELGEPDGWSVAARFASEILPGIFRLDDPCVRLRLAPEGHHALEKVVDGLPADVFAAADALGWVYQFWQKDKKDEINASERKIGGADLGPVTQLFTENYMVRFLLENSLGAWWAARHPDSPLVKGFEYLRFDDGKPAAGSFGSWPERVAEVTVMDPCCGSGHFLVEAFSMLWQMRAEEEGLGPVDAQDAVLRDNLFGLELDPRCVQIAMFNVALQAWKNGGHWRHLPVPNIACSGIPVKAPVEEWKALAGGNQRLENALARLHTVFRDADTLGSLIDPKEATETHNPGSAQRSFGDVRWKDVAPFLADATSREVADPAHSVLGHDAVAVSRAADYLRRTYSLVATNPPFLGLERMSSTAESFVKTRYPPAKRELALALFERSWGLVSPHGALAFVLPSEWTFVRAGRKFRERALAAFSFGFIARLGSGSFTTTLRVSPLLTVTQGPNAGERVHVIDATDALLPEKPAHLSSGSMSTFHQPSWRLSSDSRLVWDAAGTESVGLVGDVADARNGMSAGDGERFERQFWEVADLGDDWECLQSSPAETGPFGGMEKIVLWEKGGGAMAALADSVKHLNHAAQNWRRGKPLWGRRGVVVSQIGAKTSLYVGDPFDSSCFAIVPSDRSLVAPLAAFALSGGLRDELVKVNPTWKLTSPKTLLQLGFDRVAWGAAAREQFPYGLPEPSSTDPTQWLFEGRPEESTSPLQVTVARLVGYRWPGQADSDDLDGVADADGIVCLPSVAGEAPAAARVQQVLAAAFGEAWSPGKVKELLEHVGSKKNLADWLRDEFFKQHCALFGHRPFVWHIWDGQRGGFAALVNYHRMNKTTLQKLTYTYLGVDWVERQRAEVRDEVAGAEARLSAALQLQHKLESILDGEKPYDIYVRWKELYEQPIGWDPDLNDGVRLNIRPFVEAGVLRAPFSIHWRKDRGKNPDGSERHNDVHLSLAEKLEARKRAGQA